MKKNRIPYIFLLLALAGLSFLAGKCGLFNRTIEETPSRLVGKTFSIPDSLLVGDASVFGKEYRQNRLKYVAYMDSTMCSGCFFRKLTNWLDLQYYAAESHGSFGLYFILQPKAGEQAAIRQLVSESYEGFCFLIDEQGIVKANNGFLTDHKCCVLLNEDNTIVMEGDVHDSDVIFKQLLVYIKELQPVSIP